MYPIEGVYMHVSCCKLLDMNCNGLCTLSHKTSTACASTKPPLRYMICAIPPSLVVCSTSTSSSCASDKVHKRTVCYSVPVNSLRRLHTNLGLARFEMQFAVLVLHSAQYLGSPERPAVHGFASNASVSEVLNMVSMSSVDGLGDLLVLYRPRDLK